MQAFFDAGVNVNALDGRENRTGRGEGFTVLAAASARQRRDVVEGVAASLVVMIIIGVGWTTARVTGSSATIERLNADLTEASKVLGDTERQLSDTHEQLSEARDEAAQQPSLADQVALEAARMATEHDRLRNDLVAAHRHCEQGPSSGLPRTCPAILRR